MPKKKRISDVTIITKQFNTPMQFSQYIEELAAKGKTSLMDTLIDFCQKNDIDLDSVGKLVTRSLKEKIRTEAVAANMMAKPNTTAIV